mgnify:CR=1 FL=1
MVGSAIFLKCSGSRGKNKMSDQRSEDGGQMLADALALWAGVVILWAVSLNEILAAIPKLSFAERQQLVRRAIEADEDLTPEEEAILEERLKDFRADPRDGVPAESLKSAVLNRPKTR